MDQSRTDSSNAWMQEQHWQRDADEPCLALGEPGRFDDTHIFAPCVAFEDGTYFMWYCGSRGAVADRVFRLGLATSTDGVNFVRHPASPVCSFATGTRSVLTPALLRRADGAHLRENGRLRLWFSSCDFPSGDPRHTLHQAASADGVHWDEPSAAQLENVYAPTVIKEDGVYRMWYVDVLRDPWCLRYAESADGTRWKVEADPVLELGQEWERQRLFYPTVLKAGDCYLMWYGSYSQHGSEEMKTALGLAVSADGLSWHKSPSNPVFGPDASRSWESHYTTSQTVLRLAQDEWRIWYASRPAPPFVHKYFAIGTARWNGPSSQGSSA